MWTWIAACSVTCGSCAQCGNHDVWGGPKRDDGLEKRGLRVHSWNTPVYNREWQKGRPEDRFHLYACNAGGTCFLLNPRPSCADQRNRMDVWLFIAHTSKNALPKQFADNMIS